MAGAFAQARPSQEATTILTIVRVGEPVSVRPENKRSRDCDGASTGRTHACDPVPQQGYGD
jgi:hypothetical protein